MRLMHEQLRRIRETTTPEVRANLLRKHMHTAMEQMRAMQGMTTEGSAPGECLRRSAIPGVLGGAVAMLSAKH